MQLYTFKIISVNRVLDGDTVDLTIDLGFNLTKTDRYRMMGYDAPETFRPKSDIERKAGLLVKGYLISLLSSGSFVVRTYKDTDIYGRYSAIIMSEDGSNVINEKVVAYMKEQKLTKADLGVI
jgi:micrococcal nuclease